MRKRRGFTLIELLIVITIICVLVSILLPAVNKIKQSTAQVNCLNNMRELAQGVLSYAADNQDQLPYCNWDSNVDDGTAYGYGWLFASPRFRTTYPANSDLNGTWTNRPHEPQDGVMTGQIWPYIHTLAAYHCPIDNPEFYTGSEWLTSYLMNGAECGYGAKGNCNPSASTPDYSPGLQLRRMKAPQASVMMWEAQEQFYQGQSLTGAVWNDGSSYPFEEVLSDRHFKGANVSCYDGHVEWWDQNTWNYWESQGSFSRLWCYPLTAAGR